MGGGVSKQNVNQLTFESSQFIHQLSVNARDSYDHFLQELRDKGFTLTPDQINSIVSNFTQQERFSENILELLQQHIADKFENKMDGVISRINHLFNDYIVSEQCRQKKSHFIHHMLPHFFEVVSRTQHALDALNVLTSPEPVVELLRKMISLCVLHHDSILKTVESIDAEKLITSKPLTSEEASAEHIASVLINALDIYDNEELKAFIHWLPNSIIVLGTTTVFYRSKNSENTTGCMALSYLYFKFKDLGKEAGYFLSNNPLVMDSSAVGLSKTKLIHDIETTMMIEGLMDRFHISSQTNTEREARMECMLDVIRESTSRTLLDEFLNASQFINPYQNASNRGNQYAFVSALITHICMQSELYAKQSPGDNNLFKQLLLEGKRKWRAINMSSKELRKWLTRKSVENNIHQLMATFFFNDEKINEEVQFSQSQHEAVAFVANRLHQRGYSEYLIDEHTPGIDAKNLITFKKFYDDLWAEHQSSLIVDLLLVIITQPGEFLLKQEQRYLFSNSKSFDLDDNSDEIRGSWSIRTRSESIQKSVDNCEHPAHSHHFFQSQENNKKRFGFANPVDGESFAPG